MMWVEQVVPVYRPHEYEYTREHKIVGNLQLTHADAFNIKGFLQKNFLFDLRLFSNIQHQTLMKLQIIGQLEHTQTKKYTLKSQDILYLVRMAEKAKAR